MQIASKDQVLTLQINNNQELYSFDVFDTLITRCVAEPVGIFSIMQEILKTNPEYNDIDSFVKNNFFTLRVETESFARAYNWNQFELSDVSLDDIYEHIKLNQNLSDSQIERLKNLELQTEKNNIFPIEKNIFTLKNLMAENKRVVLISDMYLSSEQIRGLLTFVDNVFEDITIYVSNEYNKSKHEGNIYDYVAEKENVKYKNWKHYGDNSYADIKMAKRKGIITQWRPFESLMPYEEISLKNHFEDANYQSLIGCARVARMLSEDKSDAYKLGCSFAGPILYNYVKWVINQAIERNIQTLHFIARDGYVLKEIADVIIEKRNLNLKTKYIYGSRKAWRVPDEKNVDNYIKWIFSEYCEFFNLKFLAERFGITVEDFQSLICVKKCTGRIDKKKRIKLEKELLNNTEFKEFIINLNRTKKKSIKKYFEQNLDFTQEDIVFVDVNGSGRSQDVIAEFISEIFLHKKIVGYYFHLELNVKQKDNSIKKAFMSTVNYRSSCIELFCRALDGQTLGYISEEDNIIPIFEQYNKEKLLAWGYNQYLNGLKAYSLYMINFEQKNNFSLKPYEIYKKYFEYFMSELDKKTADIIGSIPYASVGNEIKLYDCAPKYNLLDFFRIFLFGNEKNVLAGISVARSSKIIKKVVKFNYKFGSLRKFLLHVGCSRSKNIFYLQILGIKVSLKRLIWRY